MISIQRWVDAFFRTLERVKGERVVREVPRPGELVAHLTGYSISGYNIAFYCQTMHYVKEYWWWFIPNRYFSMYRVYSIASNDAPLALKQACALESSFPAMAHNSTSIKMQKEVAVQAYLDILMSRIRATVGQPQPAP